MLFSVNFKYSDSHYCHRNIVIAATEGIVRHHYESQGKHVIAIDAVTREAIREDLKKGVPVVAFYTCLSKCKTASGLTRRVRLFAPDMGWDFERVIWADEAGREFIRINGDPVSYPWARERALCALEDAR